LKAKQIERVLMHYGAIARPPSGSEGKLTKGIRY
jgi:hypothetical protein